VLCEGGTARPLHHRRDSGVTQALNALIHVLERCVSRSEMHSDPRLRLLYRLAEVAEGEELQRVREAIAQRRSELELGVDAPSAFDGLPTEEPEPESIPAPGFTPAPADAVPVVEKREGERGYRVVGMRRRATSDR